MVFAAGGVADLVAIQFSHGSRVMVRRDALAVAASLLAAWGGPTTVVDDAELAARRSGRTIRLRRRRGV